MDNVICYDGEELFFERSKYVNNGNTYITAKTKYGEPYGDMSINVDRLDDNQIVINHTIQDVAPGLVKAFKEKFCVKQINPVIRYGYCTSEVVTLKDVNIFPEFRGYY